MMNWYTCLFSVLGKIRQREKKRRRGRMNRSRLLVGERVRRRIHTNDPELILVNNYVLFSVRIHIALFRRWGTTGKGRLPQIAKSTLQSIMALPIFIPFLYSSAKLCSFGLFLSFIFFPQSPVQFCLSIYLSAYLFIIYLLPTYLPTYPFIFPQLSCLFGLAVLGAGGVVGFSVPLTWNSFTCRTRHGRWRA